MSVRLSAEKPDDSGTKRLFLGVSVSFLFIISSLREFAEGKPKTAGFGFSQSISRADICRIRLCRINVVRHLGKYLSQNRRFWVYPLPRPRGRYLPLPQGEALGECGNFRVCRLILEVRVGAIGFFRTRKECECILFVSKRHRRLVCPRRPALRFPFPISRADICRIRQRRINVVRHLGKYLSQNRRFWVFAIYKSSGYLPYSAMPNKCRKTFRQILKRKNRRFWVFAT